MWHEKVSRRPTSTSCCKPQSAGTSVLMEQTEARKMGAVPSSFPVGRTRGKLKVKVRQGLVEDAGGKCGAMCEGFTDRDARGALGVPG